ncbi:MAG: lytic transglycosylase domain-containing protein [Myxococcota bacterium]
MKNAPRASLSRSAPRALAALICAGWLIIGPLGEGGLAEAPPSSAAAVEASAVAPAVVAEVPPAAADPADAPDLPGAADPTDGADELGADGDGDDAHPSDATAGPWLDRVKARLADDDAEGAARLLHWLSESTTVPQTPAVDVVRALGGNVAAAMRLVFGGFAIPGVSAWLRVAAARGVSRPYPLLGAALALPFVGPGPAGRASRLVAAEALAAAGARSAAIRLLAGGIGEQGIGLSEVPDSLANALPPMDSAAAEAHRARLLLVSRRWDQARDASARALTLVSGGPRDERARCDALVTLGRSRLYMRDHPGGAQALGDALATCPIGDVPFEAEVLLARVAFLGFSTGGPEGTLDARLAHAEVRDPVAFRRHGLPALRALDGAKGELGRLAAKVRGRFRGFIFYDPVGDEAMEMWTRLDRQKSLTRAAALLGPLVASGYRPSRERTWGQIDYWHAHTLNRLGQQEEAATAFAELALRFPVAWYGLAALVALDGVSPEKAGALRARIAAATAVEDLPATRPANCEAICVLLETLAQLGLADAVAAEADEVDFSATPDRALWLSHLLTRAGAPRRGARVAARALDRLGVSSPADGQTGLWRAAYPTPFRPLVERESASHGVDPLLVWAVMRIESAYRTTAVSHAGARGLLQLMPGTADWLRKISERTSPYEDLLDPPDNVRLGVEFLARIAERFDGSLPLVAVAYNAGPGRLRGWLRSTRQRDLMRFVEEIPYQEARDYVRSVFSAWAAYRYLYGGGFAGSALSELADQLVKELPEEERPARTPKRRRR